MSFVRIGLNIFMNRFRIYRYNIANIRRRVIEYEKSIIVCYT